MKLRRLMYVSVLSCFAVASSALAATDWSITPTVGVNFANPSVDPAQTGVSSSAKLGLDFGVLTDWHVLGNGPWSLQVGALYAMHKTDSTIASTTITQKTNALEIPVAVRYSFMPNYSVGVGPYYAMGMGDITISQSGQPDQTQTYDQANAKKGSFGALASVNGAFPMGGMDLVVDVRYLFGLSNLTNNTGSTVKDRTFEGLVGVRFPMGK